MNAWGKSLKENLVHLEKKSKKKIRNQKKIKKSNKRGGGKFGKIIKFVIINDQEC